MALSVPTRALAEDDDLDELEGQTSMVPSGQGMPSQHAWTKAPRSPAYPGYMGIVVRDAVAADARTVTEIYVASAITAWAPYERQAVRRVTDERIAYWEADLQRPLHHWWVAELGAHPVGVAGTGPSRAPSRLPWVSSTPSPFCLVIGGGASAAP
jgi:hypothetical protein